jgi:hypothetical protein
MNNSNKVTIIGYTSQSERLISKYWYKFYSLEIGNKTLYFAYEKLTAVKDSRESRMFMIKNWQETGISKWGSRALGTKKDILQQMNENKIILVDELNLKDILQECF